MKKNIEKTAINIGSKMIENGAEINRVEDTVTRILKSAGMEDINVFCISSMIIVSTENKVVTKRIRKNDLNLYEIDSLNSLSRAICNNTKYKKKNNTYPKIFNLLSIMLATGSFCVFFGGNLSDALFSGVAGIIISYKKSIITGNFAHTFCDSAIAGIISYIPSFFIDNSHPDKIMIGTIMLLIPGLTIGNAMRDIMNSDIISGVIELVDAVFTALAIALGFSVAVFIFGYV